MSSRGLVRVINPNSNAAVTAAMSEAVEPLRVAGGPDIDCVTFSDGPFGVETLADVNLAERLLMDFVQQDHDADDHSQTAHGRRLADGVPMPAVIVDSQICQYRLQQQADDHRQNTDQYIHAHPSVTVTGRRVERRCR